ncbi:D-alanyl-D-alanine carboxypeptidase / D-alanyl-D-alanine-endopeptidase (penicillin-binding protein 4) [Nakamurella panacisegetis]|uniref:D-alanyl-D-alanine carboxypeptidase / D-alanyl-D-alanine-endopeptidase (Penicillin-binding protein 4) n=1 Tax=Nakamurella panacisegetis TaxID=1090615 RepID=A0A1H0NN48_9ACTN|nr:D-alanyl-D-alanine carboxypeptidase [Nakamurella panacisegetis]SDO94167.1 D-alanyl-D-alanine carboxypeptidase / D-alanyl-D-alanine-endopeptidase (penicillin-binding protein 4) [Nakamurella panacisegetis]
MSATRSSSRRAIVIVLSIVLVAAAATVAVIFWPKSAKNSTASSSVSSVVAPPTVSAVDPPVTAPAAAVKPLGIKSGKTPTAAGVAKRLAPALAHNALANYTGEVIDAATGTVLWKKDPTTPTAPASTLKLLTGAALLTKVDPASRFTTKVVQGADPGTIILVGGGDVTLSARAANVATVYDGAPTMGDLASQVLASGVKVTKILLDTSYWTNENAGPSNNLAPGWDIKDIAGGAITHMVPLMVDGDRTDPSNETSARTGTPAVTAGKALARALGNATLPVQAESSPGQTPKNAKVLGSVRSQPMSVLLAQALLNSDNVLAEALARQVAISMGGAPSFAGERDAIKIALEDLGFDKTLLSKTTILDGSGLANSTDSTSSDSVPVGLLADIMEAAVTGQVRQANGKVKAVPALRGLLTGLPVAGVSGTLSKAENRFSSAAAKPGIGWVRAKTGSVAVTYALAGYVPDVDGRILVFALNSNGVSAPVRNAQDVFAAALRQCGCT